VESIYLKFIMHQQLNKKNEPNYSSLTKLSIPIVFQLCMMGRKEMKKEMTQHPTSISETLIGVILLL